MKLRLSSLTLVLVIACGWLVTSGAVWAQDTPRVEPIIRHPDRYDQDFNGIIDALDDLIADAIRSGDAWRERIVVVTLWEPCDEWHLDQARLLGGCVGFVYEYVCYGFSATLPIWAIPHLAYSLGDSLCIIEIGIRGGFSMDVASKIVRVRPLVWDTYYIQGDCRSSVAVIDSGIDTPHDDLGDDNDNVDNDPDDWYDVGAPGNDWAFTGASRPDHAYKVVGWSDKEENPKANPIDYDGHGTHVSGILSGLGLVDSNYTGIAPSTKLAGVRFTYDDGYDTDLSQAIAAMDQVLADKVTYRIKVCNMSWWFLGTGSPTLSDKADTMASNGVLPVASAGNSWDQSYVYDPGRSEMAITVGATNDNDQVTAYSVSSQSGDPVKPDVVAPGGSDTNGTLIKSCDNSPNDAYQELKGTSMAAPIVAGEAALLVPALWKSGASWDWSSSNDARQVKSLILMTAWETQRGEPFGDTPPLNRGGKDNIEGYGRVCVDAAIEAAMMSYPVGLTARGTFGNQPENKKVWARKLTFSPSNENCTVRLTMPANSDCDLYLYDLDPDQYGEPVILYKSTSATAGQTEEVVRSAGSQDETVYVVVKDVTPPPNSNASYDFHLVASTSSNADEVWTKDSSSDDGSVTCLQTGFPGEYYFADMQLSPSSPDIRIVPDPPMTGQPANVYVTVRNKTSQNITDATVDVYVCDPSGFAVLPMSGVIAQWQQTNVTIPANGSVEVGPFVWASVQNNSFGAPFWHIWAVVTTPRDPVRFSGMFYGEDNVTAKAFIRTRGSVDNDPLSPGFEYQFRLDNPFEEVGATFVLTASRLDFPGDWDFEIYPPLDTPIDLDPGQAMTGELYLWPPVECPMGVPSTIQLASRVVPDDASAEYDMIGSMTIGLCTDEQFADGDMSDWYVDSVGTQVYLDTSNYVSQPASLRVVGNYTAGTYAWCCSPMIEIDYMKPYRFSFWFWWEGFQAARLVEFGHIRLFGRSPSAPLEYAPNGDWENTVPIGPTFASMLPPHTWGKIEISVSPAMFEYTIWVNGTEVGTAEYWRPLGPSDMFVFEDQPVGGSFLRANFDSIAPVGTPLGIEPEVVASACPEDWINPYWNMISIPLDPAGSWEAADTLGMNPWGHLFAWDKLLKTTIYYGAHFTQMIPGSGYKFYTETDIDQPMYLGTRTHRPFKIALPKMGWSWIGCPSDSPILLADCELRNEATGQTRMLADDRYAADPWMNWAFYWWDSENDTWRYAGAVDFPGIDDSLRPWRGYMTWQRTDDVTLIIP